MKAPSPLPAAPAGFALHWHDSVGSTMDEARALIGAASGVHQVVMAGEQTAGRGRRDRAWSSPPGNLYLTVALDHGRPLAEAAQLSFVAALALRDGLQATGVPADAITLKWPNDILLQGRKLAGLLLETAGQDGGWVLIGSGINIAHFPPDTPYPATSLAASGFDITPAELAEAYLAALARWFRAWRADGFTPVRSAWQRAAAGIGGPVTARLADGEKTGIFADLDADGALLLRGEDGRTERVLAGDVFFGVQNPVQCGS